MRDFIETPNPGPRHRLLVFARIENSEELVGVCAEWLDPSDNVVLGWQIGCGPMPTILIEPMSHSIFEFRWSDTYFDSYFDVPHRQELLDDYKEFCKRYWFSFDSLGALNVVHGLERAGFRGIRAENGQAAVNEIIRLRKSYYGFVAKIRGVEDTEGLVDMPVTAGVQ
jgi:hypothetical protein